MTALNLFCRRRSGGSANCSADALGMYDDHLREEIIGFIGQESVHARTHDTVLVDYLSRHGSTRAPSSVNSTGWRVSTTSGWRTWSRANRRKALAWHARAVRRGAFTGVLGH